MAKQKNIFRVPVALKAGSENELSKKCFENNKKDNKEYHYFDIRRVANIWVCWYYKDLKPEVE